MKTIVYFCFVKIPRKLGALVRRLKYSILFENREVNIGRHARIAGFQNIEIQGAFDAGGGLWLEAISEFAGEKFSPKLVIGHGFICSESVHIGCINKILIGSRVLIGSKSLITDHTHGRYHGEHQSPPDMPPYDRPLVSRGPVVIGDNVFIGDNCVIQPGVTIGKGAVIGANSIVSRDVPAGTMVMGAPAKPVKWYSAARGLWISQNPANEAAR